MSSAQHRNTEVIWLSLHQSLIVCYSLTDSWIWGFQEWYRVRVWGVWNVRGWLWLCKAGKGSDMGWRGKSHSDLIHQVSGHACVKWFLTVRIFSSFTPPQGNLRAEKGQKGEPAIHEPVNCYRLLMNRLVVWLWVWKITWYSPCFSRVQ